MSEIFTKSYAAFDENAIFKPYTFYRHKLDDNEILIDIKYSGICHSDIHTVKSEWGKAHYPCVPGHEIVGVVSAIGKNVTKFSVGDIAGIGCLVNSCGECEACKNSFEQFCSKGAVWTYNSKDYFHSNEITKGGYSDKITVSEKFAIKVPKDAPLEKVAPLFCAGVTTYSPLVFSKVKEGMNVGVAGFGGLGVMALKYAIKMGAKVSIFARSNKKEQKAYELGASAFYTDTKDVKESFDFIISTIPTKYDISDYLRLLKIGGEMAVVGLPPLEDDKGINIDTLVHVANKKLYGSLIGGIKQTEEMLEFSLKHEIYPEVKIIKASEINEAYSELLSGNGDFRYVIDMSTI